MSSRKKSKVISAFLYRVFAVLFLLYGLFKALLFIAPIIDPSEATQYPQFTGAGQGLDALILFIVAYLLFKKNRRGIYLTIGWIILVTLVGLI